MKLATSTQMQRLDSAAIKKIGIPGVVLMENAGRATVEEMEHDFGPVSGKSVVIFAGPGNNGGDGLVIARHVVNRGGFPFVVFLVDQDSISGDAAVNALICRNLDLPGITLAQEQQVSDLPPQLQQIHYTHPVHSLVDALFGTGLKRQLEGRFAAVVRLINDLRHDQHWPVIAVDIPSGLSADTGHPLGCTILADLTVTYGLAKPGHYLHGGSTIGRLAVVDISIPKQVIESAQLPGKVLGLKTNYHLPPRAVSSHKGTFGHLLLLAGSEGKTGAAILSGQAALRSGCGLVTLAVPAKLNQIFEISLPEAMTVPLPSSTPFFSLADYDRIIELVKDKAGIVIGPGLGTNPDTGALVRRLYREVPLPMVVDADALNLLALKPESITQPAGDRILTPHPGEMSRLNGLSTDRIQTDRLQAANWLEKDKLTNTNSEIITVLKGAGTVIWSTRGNWSINSSGNNGMAAGGMGDVLSGLIGGLLAQGCQPCKAAEAGVFIHGLAADILAKKSPYGYCASEVAAALPAAIAVLHN